MNFLVRSVLLFDLPFASFLVSFALTLCLSITHTHTMPDSCVCPYSVLVLVSLFSHVALILARGSPSRFRYNFYFYVSTPQPPLSLLLPFPSPSRNQFSSPFQAWEPRNPHQTSSSSYWHKHLASITGDLLTQHASSCHICRLIFEDWSKASDLSTPLSLINDSKNTSRISLTCWAQIEEGKLKWNESKEENLKRNKSNCWISEIKEDINYW